MADDGQAAVAPAMVAERDGAGAPGSPPGALPGAAAASPASPALISVDGQSTDAQAVAVVLNDAEWPELPGALRAAAPPSPLAPTAPSRADPAQDQCGDAPLACPHPSCNRIFTGIKALRMHFRDAHNKEGRVSRDGLDATLFPDAAFCEECGCGPYMRLGAHTCSKTALAYAGNRRANPGATGRDPSPAAAPRKKKKKRAGPFAGQRRPLGEVDANGVPLDELVRLDPNASPKGRRDAIPEAAWTWLAGFDWGEVDSLRSTTYRYVPVENGPHIHAAFDVAFYALESDAPDPASPVAAAPPGVQAGRAAGFGMSDVRGHLLLHLLPRLLFFIDPAASRRAWAQALARRCRLVLEGRWKELWAEAKAADAGYNSRDDVEYAKDLCAEVSGLISAGLLSKGMERAQAKPMATLSPDVVEKLKALCPTGAAVDYSDAIKEHLPNPASLGNLSDYVASPGDEQAEEICLFRREVKGLKKRGAPGPTGLRPEHLVLLVEGRHVVHAAAYRNAIRAGAIPPTIRTILATSTFIAIQKGDSLYDAVGKLAIRPIAIGEMWRRLTGRKVFSRLAKEVGNSLAESGGQFGIGISAGGEIVHHALEILGSTRPGGAVFGADAEAAFQNIDREIVWKDVLALGDREAIAYFLLFYAEPPSQLVHAVAPGGGALPTVRILSTRGVQQGCSGGSFYFALSWTKHVLEPVRAAVPSAHPLGICDDTYIICDAADLGAVSREVTTRAADVLVTLNLTKSFYFQFKSEPSTVLNATLNISNDLDCRRQLGLIDNIPVREWDAGGGFMCNGLPIGSPSFVEERLKKFEANIAGAATVLTSLNGCSVQDRVLLLVFCINSKGNHLLRAVPPSAGMATAGRLDEIICATAAHITFTDPRLLDAAHPNHALKQLRLPPSKGGAGLASLADTYPAAYIGSLANTLDHLRGIDPIADVVAEGSADDWRNHTGPLLDVYRIWGVGLEPGDTPLSDLPKVRAIDNLKGADGALDLNYLSRAPIHAQSAFSRALIQERFNGIVSNDAVHPFVRARMKVCTGFGAADWLRALPTKDTTFTDPQYLVAFDLFFGLPIKAIGRTTTCVPTCALASARTSGPVADFASWRYGGHFFHCSAGSRLEGVTNCLGRHNNLTAILVSLLSEKFGYTCCSTQRGQALSLNDKKRIDFSAESIPRHILPRAVDVTVLHPLAPAHLDDALSIGADFLARAGDEHKIKKHGADARAAGFELIPAAFASLGAWGPGIKKWFEELWQEKIKEAKDAHEPVWPVIQKKLQWRARVSCILQRSNAQMLLSRATQQQSSCPAHAHRARASCLPDSAPYGRVGLAHSRSLSTARRACRVA
jgi:hypothetical protein